MENIHRNSQSFLEGWTIALKQIFREIASVVLLLAVLIAVVAHLGLNWSGAQSTITSLIAFFSVAFGVISLPMAVLHYQHVHDKLSSPTQATRNYFLIKGMLSISFYVYALPMLIAGNSIFSIGTLFHETQLGPYAHWLVTIQVGETTTGGLALGILAFFSITLLAFGVTFHITRSPTSDQKMVEKLKYTAAAEEYMGDDVPKDIALEQGSIVYSYYYEDEELPDQYAQYHAENIHNRVLDGIEHTPPWMPLTPYSRIRWIVVWGIVSLLLLAPIYLITTSEILILNILAVGSINGFLIHSLLTK